MVAGRAPADLDLPLRLERGSASPLPRQLVTQIQDAIRAGQLPPGARLPSTRRLAAALGVTRNVAVAAYADLMAEGYVSGQHGSGTYVERSLPIFPRPVMPAPTHVPRWLRPEQEAPVVKTASAHATDFRLGTPSVAALAIEPWRRVWRDVVNAPLPNDYGPSAGLPALREQVAGYLARSRGVNCGPDDVMITAGAGQALDLIARATLVPGDLVALEDPGYPAARSVLGAYGARLLPLPVDDDGLCVESLPCGSAAPLLVYTTPSHQYPLGVRLSLPRRLALLEWAHANDSLIVEDDYDSEFRFDAPPLPALAGLDTQGCVAYVGTFSKVLTPALRIGYLVVPAPLRRRVERLKRTVADHTPWLVEPALAAFIAGRHLDRHIRRMRRHYARKRAALEATLAPIAHLALVRGLEAGLHLYLDLRPDLDPVRIVQRLRERHVIVSTLDAHYLGAQDRQGLLLGYGGLDVDAIAEGARVLVDVITQEAQAVRRMDSGQERARAREST